MRVPGCKLRRFLLSVPLALLIMRAVVSLGESDYISTPARDPGPREQRERLSSNIASGIEDHSCV
ncbi:MAG: hypothetical protein IVW36_00290 [Dehalococcoidia bacterium]|nr:hypothetical protein [Dehalococcoidia bacterium]